MMKWYAKWTELNERDIGDASLKRLRIFAFLSLPFVPLLGILQADLLSNTFLNIFLGQLCGIYHQSS